MVLKQTSQCVKDERGRSKETAETLTAQGVAETNTLSRPFNWAYEVCGRDHSGLSVPAFYERIFEQAHPPIKQSGSYCQLHAAKRLWLAPSAFETGPAL